MNTKISVYAKSVGGIAGRARLYPDILQTVSKALKPDGVVISDSFVSHAGDRLVALVVEKSDAKDVVAAAFSKAQKISDEKGLFKNDAKESMLSFVFEERDCEQLVLFLSASEDDDFWSGIFEKSEYCEFAKSVALCRAEGEFPSVASLCERFADKSLNERGVCPVSLCETGAVRTKVVPVAALGFSFCGGKLVGPVDLFDTCLFESARLRASGI